MCGLCRRGHVSLKISKFERNKNTWGLAGIGFTFLESMSLESCNFVSLCSKVTLIMGNGLLSFNGLCPSDLKPGKAQDDQKLVKHKTYISFFRRLSLVSKGLGELKFP